MMATNDLRFLANAMNPKIRHFVSCCTQYHIIVKHERKMVLHQHID